MSAFDAVYTVIETFDGRRHLDSVSSRREHNRVFYVTVNQVVDPADVREAAGIPRLGDYYVTRSGAVDGATTCREVEVAQRNESPLEWRVEARYSSASEPSPTGGSAGSESGTGGSPGEARMDNPLARPSKVSFGFNKVRRVADKDRLGNAILNPAGDPYDPPLEADVVHLTISVTRNQLRFNPVLISTYTGAINTGTWYGFDPFTVMCTGIKATEEFESGLIFWSVSADFEVDPDNWIRRVLAQGHNQIDVLTGKYVPCMADNVRGPRLLGEDGRQLDVGGGDEPYFQDVDIAPQKDFNVLNLFT